MNIIVLDLEWNQNSTGKKERNNQVPIFEIIEIGAVKLDEKYEIVDKFNHLIYPQIYHTMHKITEELIHLQMKELKKGDSFVDVMKKFIEFCGEDYIFATWGPLDLLELQRNMKYYNMDPLSNGPIKYYDVQKLFSIQELKDKTRKTLEFAIDYYRIEKEIPFHRAFSDAYYTSKVFCKLVNKEILKFYSFDTYHLPENRKREIKEEFPGYLKYISRGFKSKKDVIDDKEVCSTKCYLCHKNLKKKVKWFTINGKHYYAISYCNEHGYIKYKIRIRKNDDEMYYAVKTSKFITEEKKSKLIEDWKKEKEIKKKKKLSFNEEKSFE